VYHFPARAEAVEALVCKTGLSGFESPRYLQLSKLSAASQIFRRRQIQSALLKLAQLSMRFSLGS